MRVKIGPYKNWFGPYQLAEAICFWAKKEKDEYGFPRKPEWVSNFGEWLAHGSVEPEPKAGERRKLIPKRRSTWIAKLLYWLNDKRKRTVKVRIDTYDTWSMDETLALITLPMLKQLRKTKHGAPYVDLEDVSEGLRLEISDEQKQQGEVDEKHFERWDWVLDEMIFAFESKMDDSWKEQFESGEHDLELLKLENSCSQMVEGPKHTKVYDWEGMKVYEARIQNGFRLFGKYYQNLWD
jgi:hypothetical protein